MFCDCELLHNWSLLAVMLATACLPGRVLVFSSTPAVSFLGQIIDPIHGDAPALDSCSCYLRQSQKLLVPGHSLGHRWAEQPTVLIVLLEIRLCSPLAWLLPWSVLCPVHREHGMPGV
jgi:hypothetical protein